VLGDYLRLCPGGKTGEADAAYLSALSLAPRAAREDLGVYAAISLARLWAEQASPGKPPTCLGTCCDGLTEGRSLPAWKEAETLRDSFGHRGVRDDASPPCSSFDIDGYAMALAGQSGHQAAARSAQWWMGLLRRYWPIARVPFTPVAMVNALRHVRKCSAQEQVFQVRSTAG